MLLSSAQDYVSDPALRGTLCRLFGEANRMRENETQSLTDLTDAEAAFNIESIYQKSQDRTDEDF